MAVAIRLKTPCTGGTTSCKSPGSAAEPFDNTVGTTHAEGEEAVDNDELQQQQQEDKPGAQSSKQPGQW